MNSENNPNPINSVATEQEESAKNVALVVYILQAFSFITVITFVIAVIINYVKRDDVRDTWIASHFRWQIRTFWFGMLWLTIGIITSPIGVGYFVLMINFVWMIYRVVRGWLNLNDNRAMYL
ncbi:DUF4870 family protein [Thiomicrorhabdus sp.]|uniref:DUF4870 family protein n=1 Tax=Thiomicrorhabdus sp. TaxID=2039724 RepID=UPI0035687956